MTRPLLFAAAALTLAAAACTPVAPPPGGGGGGPIAAAGGECFFASTITTFKPSGATAVNVRSSNAGVYRAELAAPCGDLRAAEKVLLDSRSAGASVCAGADATLIVSSPAGSRACPARSLRRLTDTEVASLPAAERP